MNGAIYTTRNIQLYQLRGDVTAGVLVVTSSKLARCNKYLHVHQQHESVCGPIQLWNIN